MRGVRHSLAVGCGVLVLGAVVGAQETKPQGSVQPRGYQEAIVVTASPKVGTPADHFLTFSAPVGIPGVTLPAGTYLFRFPLPDTKVIQVLKADRSNVYSMFQTIPVRRVQKESATQAYEVTFKSRAKDAPVAVDAWYLPSGDGYEFIYPDSTAARE